MGSYLLFVVIAIATVLSPGPGVMLTLTNAIRFGVSGAFGGILGIAFGLGGAVGALLSGQIYGEYLFLVEALITLMAFGALLIHQRRKKEVANA